MKVIHMCWVCCLRKSKEDLSSNEIINKRHVPGLESWKKWFRKTFENK